ncbi:MAG TPA: hypothetical protein VI793_02420 [Anaerolineales bacterium]|nr:hypothetical protein [Anaerolineales bacterium]
MLVEPRLITPQGQTIVLTAEQYQKVAALLALREPAPRPSVEEVRAIIKELQNMFAGGPSLAEILLEERRKDREREEARIRRFFPNA